MLWTVVVVLYVLAEQNSREPRFGARLPLGLALYASFATCATSQQGGAAQWFSFHTLFALYELPALYMVYSFFRSLDRSEEELRRLMRRGFYAYASAIVVWLTDLNLCSTLQRLPGYNFWNLHAFGWHLLTSCGLYAMFLGFWYHRLRHVLGVKVRLTGTLLPRIQLEKSG